ncbi:recombination regulator RecX [Rodentibacter rarus]|uniref:recombination regulator RecX n=1 Tax=Rodentibacter rarus TaxID=1908260 RepID=UPI0009868FC9|nr:recombination regulator RecX [Rodentibacter rarus]OOF42120.1 recombination regulator RecX [Rodentibacter rarus]
MSSVALNYIVSLLTRREYSEFELRNKMQEKGFPEEQIENALVYCQQKNWQNDKRFAETYIQARSQRGYGINRIRQELRQLKGVSNEVIDEALWEISIDWQSLALTVLRKKFPNYTEKQSPKMKQKIWHYMLSHGFYSEDFADFLGSTTSEEDF